MSRGDAKDILNYVDLSLWPVLRFASPDETRYSIQIKGGMRHMFVPEGQTFYTDSQNTRMLEKTQKEMQDFFDGMRATKNVLVVYATEAFRCHGPIHDYAVAVQYAVANIEGLAPESLTHQQKLEAMAHKYYSHQTWVPKKGDFYTLSRADLELYQVLEADEEKVVTSYLPVGERPTATWKRDEFLTGFGLNRVHVPHFILDRQTGKSHF